MPDKSKRFIINNQCLTAQHLAQPRKEYIMAKRTMERSWEEQTITILGKVYDYKELPPKMKHMCGFLGFGTKLVDNLAGMKAYSVEEKAAKVDKVYDNLMKDTWRVPGEGGKSSAKAERLKVMEAFEEANKSDRAVMRKCLAGQGYEFPEEE